MLDLVLNLAYLAVIKTFGVVMTLPVPSMDVHGIAPFEAKPIVSYFSAERHCRFHGVAVAYERDWEIVSENTMTQTRTVLPPEPGKVHSYGVIINKKTCPGKEDERVMLVGSGMTPNLFGNDRGLIEGYKVMLSGLSLEKEKQPQWLPQVMQVVEATESKNPYVKAFADYTRAGAVDIKPAATEGPTDSAKPAANKAEVSLNSQNE